MKGGTVVFTISDVKHLNPVQRIGKIYLFSFFFLNSSSWWLNQVCPIFSDIAMFHQDRYNIVVQALEISEQDQKATCLG